MATREILLAIAAGTLAALFTLLALTFTAGGFLLSNFAQMPLFLAGLALGVNASWIATISGALLTALLGNSLTFGMIFAVAVAAPVAVMVRQALLWRHDADGTVQWYPPGPLLAIALMLAALAGLSGMPAALTPAGSQLETARALIERMPPNMLPAGVTPEQLEPLIRLALRYLPGFIAAWFFVGLFLNGVVAQHILTRLGRNLRPSPRLAELALPGWFAVAAAIAAIGTMLAGIAAIVGGNFVIVAAIGFFFAGLAAIYAVVERWSSRFLPLAALYVCLVFVWPTAVLIVLLGLVEPWLRLRERFAGPALKP